MPALPRRRPYHTFHNSFIISAAAACTRNIHVCSINFLVPITPHMFAVRKLLLLFFFFFTRLEYYNYTTPGVIKTKPLHTLRVQHPADAFAVPVWSAAVSVNYTYISNCYCRSRPMDTYPDETRPPCLIRPAAAVAAVSPRSPPTWSRCVSQCFLSRGRGGTQTSHSPSLSAVAAVHEECCSSRLSYRVYKTIISFPPVDHQQRVVIVYRLYYSGSI